MSRGTLFELLRRRQRSRGAACPSGSHPPALRLACPACIFRPQRALSWLRCCRQRPQRQVRDGLSGADRYACLNIVGGASRRWYAHPRGHAQCGERDQISRVRWQRGGGLHPSSFAQRQRLEWFSLWRRRRDLHERWRGDGDGDGQAIEGRSELRSCGESEKSTMAIISCIVPCKKIRKCSSCHDFNPALTTHGDP
jgi:hypothetical protein